MRFFTATFAGLLVLESSFFVGGHVSHACIYVRTGQGLSLFGLGAPVWRRGAGRVAFRAFAFASLILFHVDALPFLPALRCAIFINVSVFLYWCVGVSSPKRGLDLSALARHAPRGV